MAQPKPAAGHSVYTTVCTEMSQREENVLTYCYDRGENHMVADGAL